MLTYKDFKGQIFVFIGTGAIMKTRNPITSNVSYFGTFFRCNDKQQAWKVVEHFNNSSGVQYLSAIGTARSLRKYDLGNSVQDYLYTLKYAAPVLDIIHQN